MNTPDTAARVVSIHLHAAESGAPLQSVLSVEAIADKGLVGDRRYFGRKSRRTGGPSRRQVTLIEREVLQRHAATLGLPPFAPGEARSNFETEGIDLSQLVGRELQIGTTRLAIVEHREPCAKMDALAPGLRTLMTPPCQGVIAIVLQSGTVSVGDSIHGPTK
jgi:MOSC domain-containing protein YiiM